MFFCCSAAKTSRPWSSDDGSRWPYDGRSTRWTNGYGSWWADGYARWTKTTDGTDGTRRTDESNGPYDDGTRSRWSNASYDDETRDAWYARNAWRNGHASRNGWYARKTASTNSSWNSSYMIFHCIDKIWICKLLSSVKLKWFVKSSSSPLFHSFITHCSNKIKRFFITNIVNLYFGLFMLIWSNHEEEGIPHALCKYVSSIWNLYLVEKTFIHHHELQVVGGKVDCW